MAKNLITISCLSDEVLINIFEYLNIRNRLKASMVCKRWLYVINCRRLLQNVRVTFSTEFLDIFKSSRMTRKFEWFVFYRVLISDSVIDFLNRFSKQFVKLEFVDCKVHSDKRKSKYRERFLKCDNLKYLKTENSDAITLFTFIPNVTTLMMHRFSGLTDYVVSQLNKTLFKLEFFSLSSYVIYNEADYKKIYVNGETIETNPSKSVLSFASVKKFIEKHNTMKALNISMLQLSPEALLTISDVNGLKLEDVLFPPNLPSDFIKKFCKNQFSLTSLQLTSLLYVADDTISALCKCLPNLKRLLIKQNHVIDDSVVEIFQLKHLEVLDLDNCKAISQLSYQQAVLKLKSFKLKELNLAFAQIGDDSLCELLMHNLNIRYLNISNTSVSNKTLNRICKNLINLVCLELDSCVEISDPGITGEFEFYSNSITPTPLSNLKNLRKLDLSNNSLITNNGCTKAIKFPYLKSLLLLECDLLTFCQELEMILVKQNPRLSHFIISNNSKRYMKFDNFFGYHF